LKISAAAVGGGPYDIYLGTAVRTTTRVASQKRSLKKQRRRKGGGWWVVVWEQVLRPADKKRKRRGTSKNEGRGTIRSSKGAAFLSEKRSLRFGSTGRKGERLSTEKKNQGLGVGLKRKTRELTRRTTRGAVDQGATRKPVLARWAWGSRVAADRKKKPIPG